jgi:hypothetical protein
LSYRSPANIPMGYTLQLREESNIARWVGLSAYAVPNQGTYFFPKDPMPYAVAAVQWTNLVLRTSASEAGLVVELFVDGKLVNKDKGGVKSTYYAKSGPFVRVGYPTNLFAGTIGLVRFWPSLLSDGQIADLYNANAARFGRVPTGLPATEALPPPELHYEAAKCQ